MTDSAENNKSSSKLPVINFILILLIGLFVLVNQSEQSQRINSLVEVITSKHTVDFSVSNTQQIDNVFMLTGATQEKHLTGVKFSGRIINSQAVDHLNIEFTLSVGEASKEFTINKISSGNSTGFNVYIPELSLQSARYVKIEYVSSQIAYLAN